MHILISAVSSAKVPSGICRHAANLALSLKDMREISRVTLLVGAWQSSYFKKAFHLHRHGVDILSIDIGNTGRSRNIWYHRTLPKIATAAAADLVHLSFPAPISRRKFGCPVVCTLHDLYPYDIPNNFGSARAIFNRLFLRRCIEESDFLICSSDFTLERLRVHLPGFAAGKAARIHPIVALSPGDLHTVEFSQSPRRPFLLAVAQHRRNKNLTLIIDGFAELRRKRADSLDLRLVIVGSEGPETKSLYGQVRRHSLADHVSFINKIADEELCWLYRYCEAVLVSSTIEGFCLPVVEAQQCGARVVCSDIPVLREVGGADCRFVSLAGSNSALEFARAIASALHRRKPQPQTDRRFSPHEIARQHVALYRALLAGASEEKISATANVGWVSPRRHAV